MERKVTGSIPEDDKVFYGDFILEYCNNEVFVHVPIQFWLVFSMFMFEMTGPGSVGCNSSSWNGVAWMEIGLRLAAGFDS